MHELDRGGVWLMFPGQGSQYPRMGASLYGSEPVFTHWMDTAFGLLEGMGEHLREEWLSPSPSPAFDDVTVAQPLLYAVDHALGRMVLAWGVEPRGLLGHSVGELVAATLAGVLGFEDGLAVMADRVAAFADTPVGGMAAVAAAEEEVSPFLSEEVHLAAVNAPRQTMIAGRTGPLSAAMAAMAAAGLTCAPVRSRQAFHSPLVNEGVAASLPAWEAVPLAPPGIPVVSAYLPGRLTGATACDAHFWAEQPARQVRFFDALQEVLALGPLAVVECGPSGGLTAIARRQRQVVGGGTRALALLPDRPEPVERERQQVASVRAAVAELRAEVAS